MPDIEIRNLKLGFADKKTETIVLDGLSADFEDGKFSVIAGESGCGKTTLLKAIIGVYDYEGSILVDGRDISSMKVQDRNLAYVSQAYSLYPHLTVFDNIAFPLKVLKAPREEIIARVFEIARKLEIEHTLTRKPKVLSGGQQQRVAIARALIKHPDLLLLDEPLSNIDPMMAASVRRLVKNVCLEMGVTVLYVTHNLEHALSLADRIYIMEDGKIGYSGTPKELFSSDNRLAKAYVEGMKIHD